ncbi:MAG: ATP-binding protein [Massilia sp.]|nr:ATP-binding protein [Aquabacterium sp.]
MTLLPCPVDSLFDDADALLTPIAEAKQIALCFTPVEGLVAHADQKRLYQVIANLVVNAVKFTPEGGRVDVAAELDSQSSGRLVRFSVTDNGAGMSEDHLSHIFERYWRVREANPKGTGLGLYIARGVVEAHGGTIWAESELGRGTTMYFTLPHADSLINAQG